MVVLFFLGSVFFICCAHLLRIFRWELFISIYEKPDRKNLIRSMTVGYLLNCVLPFKLGELFRAWISGKKMRNGKSLGFSTVIVERYLDIVFVGWVFIFLSLIGIGGEETKKAVAMYVLSAVILLIFGIVIYGARSYVKRVIRIGASIFNTRIESAVLAFAWALIWNFKDIFQKISKRNLAFLTIAMWSGYFISYYLFAAFLRSLGIGATWAGVILMLFSQGGISSSAGSVALENVSFAVFPLAMTAYLVLPLMILFGLTLLPEKNTSKSEKTEEDYLRLLPQIDSKERLAFLEMYFSDTDREYLYQYLKINQSISIVRDYSAGSNATTMLCMDGRSTFFRKYAFGADGEKLYQQIQWLNTYKDKLPLPTILRYEKSTPYCYYDMPFSGNSVGLFEYVHCMPLQQAWKMIRMVMDTLETSIYQINVRPADESTIRNYITQKVIKNLKVIKNTKRFKDILQYKTVFINGEEYHNLSYYETYLSEENLRKIFQNDTYAVIHGDLTIENIICTRADTGEDHFYIIDPNPGNVHDSPNLDYAKLLQSIHGGYEFLMSTKDVQITDNQIRFQFTRSSTYIELHKQLKAYIQQQFGADRTRSIYYHEIVHWLRLMPYKIEKEGKRALLFYAGMLMVMNDVVEMFHSE